MKKNKLLILCAILMAGSLCLTACGGNENNGTEAPYEDETNKDVNDINNGMNNGGMNNNGAGTENNGTGNGGMNSNGTQNGNPSGSDLEDAGRNLMDSIKDTGDAIRDGVDNLGNGNNNRTNP